MLLAVYDNSVIPSEMIREIIGSRGFGDVVVRRKPLGDFYHEAINDIFDKDTKWLCCDNVFDVEKLAQDLDTPRLSRHARIIHCFSDYIVSDVHELSLTYKKIDFIDGPVALTTKNGCAAVLFEGPESYKSFLRDAVSLHDTRKAAASGAYPDLEVTGLSWIGSVESFIQCVTGNFDSRFFNSLGGDSYVIRKSSTDKRKIKAEYTYWHLLPDAMRRWVVMPFDYREDDSTASYAMERLHMTDIAIKWVHGSIGTDEFSQLMDMYFTFFAERPARAVSEDRRRELADALYVGKVQDRVEKLKKLPGWAPIAHCMEGDDRLSSIDCMLDRYLALKKRVESRAQFTDIEVIGHGDPCFANAMYNRSTRTLKLIDPKGALTEDELWTDPYYDIAKLSHSVCGNYDFFNNAMFDISLGEDFHWRLHVPFDNSDYVEIFREHVEAAGYDWWSVRLYEASLFLSMLPLHMDYPHKVFGFVLNAERVLEEVEAGVGA